MTAPTHLESGPSSKPAAMEVCGVAVCPTEPPWTTPLFETPTVAGLRLENRFVMAPMTRERAVHGVPAPDMPWYYARRASGGVGLIVTEGIAIEGASAHHDPAVPRLNDASAGPWRRVVEAVHAEGSKIVAQLWHLGGERVPSTSPLTLTPSGVAPDGSPNGRPLTVDDIEYTLEAYGAAARLAQEIGFDGVELHGAHGYLLHEFLWPATNRRTDAYGGGPRERARFAAETVAAVRAAVGPDFPLIYRFSQFAERDYSARVARTPEELGGLLRPIVEAGVDVLHASQRRFWEPAFPNAHPKRNLAGWAKALTGLPTITVGSIGLRHESAFGNPASPSSLEALAERQRDGEFDLVAIGRPLLRTADWVDRARAGRVTAELDYSKADERRYP
ncbi:12-oxophytodienoate reductase [Agromyces sp. NPDC049794]|uniref:oxidoreductase n=1 Tax=unclassified Agromyces TaxID=2639701 RepID=UPI0033F43380